jgi:hypothetical protein
MLKHLPAFAAACVLTALPAVAQDHAGHQAQTKLMKGASVSIEGCVTAGQKADTFVLGSVKEIPGVPVDTPQRRVYWLNSVKELRGHAGHVVRIDGRIDKLEQHEIEVKLGDAEGGAWVEIEGPGKQVKTAPATIGVGTAGQTAKEVDIPTTVIRLDVDKVTMLKDSCGGPVHAEL